jgi:biopolymer transport protein ExbD
MAIVILRCVALCSIAGCLSPVMTFGAGKTAKQSQRDIMTDMTPARLVTGETWAGDVATRKIRVWADNQYRAQNVRWQETFDGTLELANLVLTPLFGLRLVADYRVWDRHVPGSRLPEDLQALGEHDPGRDVFAVVGLTSSLPLVSATFEDLGYASVGGRHMVLRGYADQEERKVYADVFADLTSEERELALTARRDHKTAIVLLHEIGHNLGIDHEPDEDTIMSARYSHRAGRFSASARAVILRTIEHRLGRTSSQPADAPPGTHAAAVPVPPTATPESPRPAAERQPAVVIHVTRTGATLVAGKRLDADALDKLLQATFALDPETPIVIKEDRKVPVGAVGKVIDRAKAIGLTKFTMGWAD